MAKVGEDREPAVAERVNLPVMPDEPALLRFHLPQRQKSPKSGNRTQRAPIAAEASSALPGLGTIEATCVPNGESGRSRRSRCRRTPNYTSPVAGESLAWTRTRLTRAASITSGAAKNQIPISNEHVDTPRRREGIA
jgi:hypothetical protein